MTHTQKGIQSIFSSIVPFMDYTKFYCHISYFYSPLIYTFFVYFSLIIFKFNIFILKKWLIWATPHLLIDKIYFFLNTNWSLCVVLKIVDLHIHMSFIIYSRCRIFCIIKMIFLISINLVIVIILSQICIYFYILYIIKSLISYHTYKNSSYRQLR